ncbi:glycosyltransferase family 32 protein [Calocera viscosa TUFC12733]|uniref:Glycosyltransferase family 32 protein n=1 Tax=Calocera viscosa (strain TUFC12733) TaxID=1330018 RepID=A0A167S6C4_CALVF|nr:glycosyltransferase family 32 protein [Calocera viscosa TUFC12733]
MHPLQPLAPGSTHQKITVLAVFTLVLYSIYHFITLYTLDTHTTSRIPTSSLLEFHVHPSLLPPPPPPQADGLPELKLDLPPFTEIPAPYYPNVVPPIVHYVMSMGDGEPKPLQYFQYLALRSALLNLRPRLILIHHRPGAPPHGPWWDLLQPHVTLSPVEPPEEVFGRPLRHYAHKADVVRMQVMLQLGGLYLDQDTFVLRSFDAAGLFTQSTVLGMEADPYAEQWEWEPGGLCNAIIVSKPGASFLQRWFATYQTFNDTGKEWAEHSVAMPWELALTYPQEVTVLNSRALFYPLWDPHGVRLVHEPSSPGPKGGGWDFSESRQLAYHAWESVSLPYLQKLTPSAAALGASSFTRMVQPFMTLEDQRIEDQIVLAASGRGQ